jgi:hypothetical protein
MNEFKENEKKLSYISRPGPCHMPRNVSEGEGPV